MSERQKKYHKYLQSEEWGLLRSLAKLRNKRTNEGKLVCVDCGKSTKRIYDVHHEAYPESENYYMDDCCSKHVVLCRECHEIRHGLINDNMMLTEPKEVENSYLGSVAAFLFNNQNYIGRFLKEVDTKDISKNWKNLFEFIFYHNDIDDNLINKEEYELFKMHSNALKKHIKKIEKPIKNNSDNPMYEIIYNCDMKEYSKKKIELEKDTEKTFKNIIRSLKKKRRKSTEDNAG